MATFSEIVSQIAHLVEPSPSQTTLRVVGEVVLNYRAMFIRRDVERNGIIPDHYVQKIPCQRIEEVDGAECGIYESDCPILRTAEEIPLPIRLKKDYAFRFVGNIDRTKSYNYIHPDAVKSIAYSRYAKKSQYYTYLNKRIYLINASTELLRIEAAFEDPKQLFDFKDCSGNPLYDLDKEFPISRDLQQSINLAITQGELRIIKPSRENEVHTSSDENAQRG